MFGKKRKTNKIIRFLKGLKFKLFRAKRRRKAIFATNFCFNNPKKYSKKNNKIEVNLIKIN